MAYEKNHRSRSRSQKSEKSRAISVCIFALAVVFSLLNKEAILELWRKDGSTLLYVFQQGRIFFLLMSGVVLLAAIGITVKYISNNDYLPNSMGYLFHPFKGYQHRRIAETHIGRRLKRNEEVHHINGNANDNEKGNLCVITKKNHTKYHKWLRKERARLGRYPSMQAQKTKLNQLGGRAL